jgi:hypothetical protein
VPSMSMPEDWDVDETETNEKSKLEKTHVSQGGKEKNLSRTGIKCARKSIIATLVHMLVY